MSNPYDGVQFLRKVSLIVYSPDDTGKSFGLDLGAFRIRFNVRQQDEESPNNADITVYNLSDQTLRRLEGEFQRVKLSVGYASTPLGQIFDGTITQLRVGRESNTDRFAQIIAADSDVPYNFGLVKQTFAAGTDPTARVKALALALNLPEPELPDISTANPASLSRGKVAFGMARSVFRDEAENLDANWSFQNGQLQMVSKQGYLPNDTVVLTAATGLVGMPVQAPDGIYIRCLLNPRLRIGGAVKLDNRSITRFTKGVFELAGGNFFKAVQFAAPLNQDGLYRCYVVEHSGDTRGNEWYSDITALAIAKSAQPGNAVTSTAVEALN